MHQAQPKEGHKIWLTQEADAKSWSSLKHVQPKEGRKELAPREIKFRYRRLDTTIRERAGSSQEGRKRAKDTPGYFLCFFFLFIPNSRCSWRVFAPWTRRESPMVQNRERQPHNQLRLLLCPWRQHSLRQSRVGRCSSKSPVVKFPQRNKKYRR